MLKKLSSIEKSMKLVAKYDKTDIVILKIIAIIQIMSFSYLFIDMMFFMDREFIEKIKINLILAAYIFVPMYFGYVLDVKKLSLNICKINKSIYFKW